MQVDAVKTPVDLAGQAVALVPLLTLSVGPETSQGLCELCLAQLALENANGSALFNWNPGNVTTTTANDFYILSKLHTDSQGHAVTPGDPTEVVMRFRAYPSIVDGMRGYVSEVVKRKSMVTAGQAGDTRAFARAIRDTGYTPGIDVDAVAKSLFTKVQEIRSKRLLDFFSLPSPGAYLSDLPPAPAAPPIPGGQSGAGGAFSLEAARAAYQPSPKVGSVLIYGAVAFHYVWSRWVDV